MKDKDAIWGLDELSREVARRLARHGLAEAQADGRVAATPDPRTIRYYQTLGLVDRPIYRGRTAWYGMRHALQLIAIKLLQANGHPLAAIQARLYGRTDAELEQMAGSAVRSTNKQLPEVRPIVWREITIEPGLKLMVDSAWTMKTDPTETIRNALVSLVQKEDGGPK